MGTTTTKNLLTGYLKNAMRMRYAPKSILPYADNELAHLLVQGYSDARLKKELTLLQDRMHDLGSDQVIMNPNILGMSEYYPRFFEEHKSDFSLSQPFLDGELVSNILKDLNLEVTKEDLQKIKDKNIKLAFVGMGGAMLNTLNVLNYYAIKHGEVGIFDKIIVFEKDTVDFTNLFRFGKPLLFSQTINMLSTEDKNGIPLLKKLYLIDSEKILCKSYNITSFDEWLTEKHAKILDEKGYTIVGAPGIDTRVMLSNYDFYFLGHGNFEVDVAFKQTVDQGLAVETYGTVDIPALLINFTLAASAFIKSLAADEKPEPDKLVFRFDLKKYLIEKGDWDAV